YFRAKPVIGELCGSRGFRSITADAIETHKGWSPETGDRKMLVRTKLLFTFLMLATAAAGQQQPQPTTTTGERRDVTPAKTPEQLIPHEFELSFFAGGSYFRGIDDPLRTKLVRGGMFGASFTADPWKHIGIETGYTIYGVN